MRKVTLDDLITLERYEQLRPAYRARVLELKRARRLDLGPATLLFENTSTVLFQLLEVLRTEGPHRHLNLRHEVAHHNVLVPEPGELRACLFLERNIGQGDADTLLSRFCDGLCLQVGDMEVPAELLDEEPIGWLGYVRFEIPPRAAAQVMGNGAAVLIHMQVSGWSSLVAVPGPTRLQLADDLRGRDGALHPLSISEPVAAE